MTALEAYRTKARDCLAVAGNMHGPAERVAMLRIAEHYMRLADRAADGHDIAGSGLEDQRQSVS
jgi:hypothetical protein